jgi:hypothetical protein
MTVLSICKLFFTRDQMKVTLQVCYFLKKIQSLHINTGFSLLLYRGVKLNKSGLKATPSTK